MDLEIEGIIKNFLEVLEQLIDRFGVEPVASALEELLPGFRFELQPAISGAIGPDAELVTLDEGKGKAAMGLLRKAKDFIASKLPGRTGTAVATTGAGAAAGKSGMLGRALSGIGAAGSFLVGKNWDQDVNIDGITTDDALNVKSKSIEDLLLQNQKAIEKMIQVMTQTQQELSKKLGDLDKSVDYLSTDEDESVETANIRQDLGLSRTKSKKSDKNKSEKEKKAKEMEKAQDRDLPTV